MEIVSLTTVGGHCSGQHLGSMHSEAVGAETCLLSVARTPELRLPLSCFVEAGNDLEPHGIIKIKWGEGKCPGQQDRYHLGPGSEAEGALMEEPRAGLGRWCPLS